MHFPISTGTYDHRVWKTGLPVRSAVLKPHAGELVVGWVTTSESSLLYVFVFVFLSCRGRADRLKSIGWSPHERDGKALMDETVVAATAV